MGVDRPEKMRAHAETLLKQGFRRFQVKVGSGHWQEDVKRARACLDVLRDQEVVICDANAYWKQHEAAQFIAALEDEPIYLEQPCRTLEECLEAGLEPRRLRGVLVGGGPVPAALVERARARGIPVLLTYGLTEACSQVTTEHPGEADGTTAGAPLPGLELRIVDAQGQPLPAGEEGTIAVRGPTLMRGYLDDEAATAEVLQDGWLHTGDLGRMDPRGRLTVLARRTDLILSGGENVYPAEVEAVLSAHPGVAEVAVVGRPDSRWGQVPVAVVVPRPAAALDDLRAWARARLAAFKVPAEVVPATALPRTAAGKVDRAAVQAAVRVPSGPCPSEKTGAPESSAVRMEFK